MADLVHAIQHFTTIQMLTMLLGGMVAAVAVHLMVLAAAAGAIMETILSLKLQQQVEIAVHEFQAL